MFKVVLSNKNFFFFTQMEGMKAEMTAFFNGHVEALASMRETAVHGFCSLQAEHSKLKEQINQAGHQHQTVRVFIYLYLN